MLEINDHDMHVYAEGEGPDTFVFMSGWLTQSPYLDFKGLYSELSDDNRIVVVERSGYGFSESSDSPRDIDTVLAETRLALTKAGETGPYILVPHSVGGIEAIYWAQKYPEEIKAVIGLDAAVPEQYLTLGSDILTDAVSQQEKNARLPRFGLIRFMPDLFDQDEALIKDYLSESEWQMYKTLVYRSYFEPDMIAEGFKIYENAKLVDSLKLPIHIPIYYFIATELGEEHLDQSIRFVDQFTKGEYEVIEGNHYIHDEKPEYIAERIESFVQYDLSETQ